MPTIIISLIPSLMGLSTLTEISVWHYLWAPPQEDCDDNVEFTTLFLWTEAQFQYCGVLGLIGLGVGNFFLIFWLNFVGVISVLSKFLYTFFLHHLATWCMLEILDSLYLSFSWALKLFFTQFLSLWAGLSFWPPCDFPHHAMLRYLKPLMSEVLYSFIQLHYKDYR